MTTLPDHSRGNGPFDSAPRRLVRLEIPPRTILTVIVVILVLYLLFRLIPVILVLVTALSIMGTVAPAIEWLNRHGMKRGHAIGVIFIGLALIAILLIGLTIPSLMDQMKNLLEHAPAFHQRAVKYLSSSRLTAPLAGELEHLNLDSMGKQAASWSLNHAGQVIEFLTYALGAIFLALYMLIDRDRIRGAVFALVPRQHHVRLSRIVLKMGTIVAGYIRGQLITSALLAIFTFVLLMICGVQNPLPIAVIAGITDVLPYIGVILSVGPATLAGLGRGPGIAITIFVLMLIYEEVESRFIIPNIYGRALRLPSSAVLFALLVGGTLAGITGALLALPVAAGCIMLIEELRVELPGEQNLEEEIREKDERTEQEYVELTEGLPAEEASAIALKIADEHTKEELQQKKLEEEQKAKEPDNEQ